jgi:hypothetical protein
MVADSHVIQFQCRKGIACWNACCSNIDISLTPYDILRMKRAWGSPRRVPAAVHRALRDGEGRHRRHQVLKPVERRHRLPVHEAGRLRASMRTARPPAATTRWRCCRCASRTSTPTRDSYALVKEEHCLGHNEPRSLTIDDYRKEQGLRNTTSWRAAGASWC